MSRITLATGTIAILLAGCAAAPTNPQADEHAVHQHDASAAASSADASHQDDQTMAHMHGNMRKMHEMMAKIHVTDDPAERQKLMAEHRAAMRSQMQAMHGMMSQGSCPMMSGGHGTKGGGMMGGKKGGMMRQSQGQHQCQMMQHMQMMHGMMEQMMEHMSAEHDDKKGDKPEASSQKPEEHVH